MNTKRIGEISQGAVLAALLKAGKIVLIPFGDNQRYDLVIDEGGKFIRVQVKTARVDKSGDNIVFRPCSTYSHRGGKQKSYCGDVELFGVYCPANDRVFIIPVENVGISEAKLRIRDGKKTTRFTRFANDFEIYSGVAQR